MEFKFNVENNAPKKEMEQSNKQEVTQSSVEKSPETTEALTNESIAILDATLPLSDKKIEEIKNDPVQRSWFERKWPILMAGGLSVAAVGTSMLGLIPLGIALGIPAAASWAVAFKKEENIKTVSGGSYFNSPG